MGPLIPMNPTVFNRLPFTEEEVLKVCKDINITKSSVIDNIKSCAFISNINCTIVPFPKVSQPKIAFDLRPVALTPLPGKLMEKLVCSRTD